MVFGLNDLSGYSEIDEVKIQLIEDVFRSFPQTEMLKCNGLDPDFDISEAKPCFLSDKLKVKHCPKCGREYSMSENVCLECLVLLRASDEIDIMDIESDFHFVFKGKNTYDDFNGLLSSENMLKINEFNFTIDDFSQVLHDIKSQAFKNFDQMVKSNKIDFDSLDILDKIIIFTKSFAKVEYKSSGGQLGYFERNTIFVDDRQTKSLQITTLIHELSHFLIQEILIGVICRILNCSANSFVEYLTASILSYSSFTQLIDEYAAHNVEGRFTIFGFQDYSSYKQIEKSLDGHMTHDEIEITKSIGNTFAINIKDILESLIDKDLRKDIKDQFMRDCLDRPNYSALSMENCQMLNDEGFMKAIWLILNEGFEFASSNADKILSQIK